MAKRPRTPTTAAPYPPGWEPFLDAIRSDVEDDTARLVFADWLQENGDEARAEFIRLQCRVSRLRHDDPEVATAGPRCDALVAANWRRWVAGLPPTVLATQPPLFWRGFVSMFRLTGAQFVKHGDAVVRFTPVEDLSLCRPTASALRPAALTKVGGLYLDQIDSARVAALAESSDLSRLRQLHLSTMGDRDRPTMRISRVAVRALLANPSLHGLRRFELRGTPHGDEVAFGIANGVFTELRDLTLYDSKLSAGGLRALVHSASAPSLTNLHLAGNRFGGDGIRHLVTAPNLNRVECINVAGCGLTSESARLLADWPGLRTVRWLQLGDDLLPRADADRIRSSPHAVALTDLGYLA